MLASLQYTEGTGVGNVCYTSWNWTERERENRPESVYSSSKILEFVDKLQFIKESISPHL